MEGEMGLEEISFSAGAEKIMGFQALVAAGWASTNDTIARATRAKNSDNLELSGRLSIQPSPYRTLPHASKRIYCRSYSPLLTFLSTVNPAFLASEMDNGLSLVGVLKPEMILRTGFLQAGQLVSGLADSGRRSVNRPPHTLHSPSQSSYS